MPSKLQKLLLNVRIFVDYLQLKQAASFSVERTQRLQGRRIHELMRHAYTIEFYRKRFDAAGLTPDDFRCSDDLRKFPVLTKAEYRAYVESELAHMSKKQVDGLFCDGTSGSTGMPFTVRFTPREYAARQAKWLRVLWLNGHSVLFGKVFAIVSPHRMPKRDSLLQIIGLARRTTVSQLDTVMNQVAKYNRTMPTLLYGNKSLVVNMLLYARNNCIPMHKPKHYICVAEMMDAQSRKLLFDAFGAEGYAESYGCTETGVMACTVKGKQGLRICNDTNVLLVTGENGQAANEGELLVTSLFQKRFPLINYRIGDNVTCETDEHGMFISKIKGRSDDWFVFENGEKLSCYYFYEAMESVSFVDRFRAIQEDCRSVTIQAVRRSESEVPIEECEQIICRNMKHVFGNRDIKVHIEWLSELAPDPNGKVRLLISNVKE